MSSKAQVVMQEKIRGYYFLFLKGTNPLAFTFKLKSVYQLF